MQYYAPKLAMFAKAKASAASASAETSPLNSSEPPFSYISRAGSFWLNGVLQIN